MGEAAPAATAAAAPAEYNQGKDECIYGNHPKTLVEIAAGSPDFSVLVAALNASDLTGAFDDISQKVTVFAPTDAAFTKLFNEFNVTAEAVLGNKKFLTDVLTFHVAPGVYPFGTLAQDDGAAISTLHCHRLLLWIPCGHDRHGDGCRDDAGRSHQRDHRPGQRLGLPGRDSGHRYRPRPSERRHQRPVKSLRPFTLR